MKCMSCESEINPQWSHAIEINVCPFCGKHIMEEILKNLFNTLRTTMESLASYQSQLDDWMLSNHNYIKTNSPQLISFVPKDQLKVIKNNKVEESEDKKFITKVKLDNGEEADIVAEKIQTEEQTNEFFKRAEVVKPNIDGFKSTTQKTEHLKKMVQQIKKTGAANSTNLISQEMVENADPAEVEELSSLLDNNLIISPIPNTGEDDDIPDIVKQMASSAKGGGKNNAADLLKLQQQHERLRISRENFESGANRGGKSGGFSRSG